MRWRLVLFAALGVFLIRAASQSERLFPHEDRPAPIDFFDPSPLRGVLRLSFCESAPRNSWPASGRSSAADPRTHCFVYANGPLYSGMEDNDLRGFLDGTFKYAWNQPTQVHVRVGRRDTGPRYGEYEIFRVLHRWADVRIPPGARVVRTRLQLHVERGPADSLRLLLYEVKKDWNPGHGGTLHDNVSPPVRGEVWWNDVAFAESSWALPGVGFASETNPRADTGAMPLAEAHWAPGESMIEFESEALARYATRRATEGLPLLFLLKTSDPLEDTPGTIVTLYSGNTGDSRNDGKRPHLALDWESPPGTNTRDLFVHLEHGRSLELPAFPSGAGTLFASFIPEAGSIGPTLEYRTGGSSDTSAWARFDRVVEVSAVWAQVRITAAVDPIVLGEPFRAALTDTWIRTASPEAQRVPWVFVSPTGVRHDRLAQYRGESKWEIEFIPDELGSWRYSWSQHFDHHPFASGEATFDVLGGGLENLRTRLAEIASSVTAADRQDPRISEWNMARFARLERALLLELTPERFASAKGESARVTLRAVREALGGHAIPESLPMVPDDPAPWVQSESKKR